MNANQECRVIPDCVTSRGTAPHFTRRIGQPYDQYLPYLQYLPSFIKQMYPFILLGNVVKARLKTRRKRPARKRQHTFMVRDLGAQPRQVDGSGLPAGQIGRRVSRDPAGLLRRQQPSRGATWARSSAPGAEEAPRPGHNRSALHLGKTSRRSSESPLRWRRYLPTYLAPYLPVFNDQSR